MALGFLFFGIVEGIKAVRDGMYADLLQAAILIVVGAYIISIVYRNRAGGKTFVDRVLIGLLIFGIIFLCDGIFILIFGWTKTEGTVPRSEGLFPGLVGMGMVLIAGIIKGLLKYMRHNKETEKSTKSDGS